jgi:hypothetical protein
MLSGGSVSICGKPIPIDPGCTSNLKSTPPTVCGKPIPTNPCTPGNGACDFVEKCIGNLKVAQASPSANAGKLAVCGTSAPDCTNVPAVCGIIGECLGSSAGTAVYASKSYGTGGLTVCGVDPHECTVQAICNIDCLQKMGQATYTGSQLPNKVSVCGIDVPLPCSQQSVETQPLKVCGIPLEPCKGNICDNPCAQAILNGVAVHSYNQAHAANSKPAINVQYIQPPGSVCGVNLPDQCRLASALGVPPGLAGTLMGLGSFSTRHYLHQFEGQFQKSTATSLSCQSQPCPPNVNALTYPVTGNTNAYVNLDCPCDSGPRVFGIDTDGDFALDDVDVDDDCDALVDELEYDIYDPSTLDFDSKVYDQIYIMNPYETPGQGNTPPEFRVGVKHIAISADWDHDWCHWMGCDNGQWIDPYVSVANPCFSNPSCPTTDSAIATIPGMNAATHPHDLGTSGHTFPNTAGTAWSTATGSAVLPSNKWDFTDPGVPSYRWRAVPSDTPNLSVRIAILDHDCAPDETADTDDQEDCTGDDNVGDEFPVGMSFWQLAMMVNGAFNPTSLVILDLPGDVDGDGIKDLRLELQQGINISGCAVDAAKQNAGGIWEITALAPRLGGAASVLTC